MSRLWFNIRFGVRHFQLSPDGISFKVNLRQVDWRNNHPDSWKWFEVYCIFGKHLT